MIRTTAPISAIVICRNERAHLERCLPALRWCDEMIVVDMRSTDGSRAVALQWADRVFEVDPQPIAEPTRVAAAQVARHDWVLLVDPDEVVPPALVERVRRALAERPDAGAFSLPMRFYFKGRLLDSSIWGAVSWKQRLIHRGRCELLPWCNRITRLRDGQSDVRIEHDGANHMQHYWCDSYRALIRRHLTRYCHTEARAVAASGQRFSLWWGVSFPVKEWVRSMRDYDGWRDWPRGWLLSAVYFSYVAASSWLVPYYQRRPATLQSGSQPVPELRECFARRERAVA